MPRTSRIKESGESKSFDYKSLDAFIKAQIAGENKAAEAYAKAKEKAIKRHVKQQLSAIQELANFEASLEGTNIALSDTQRKRYLLDEQKKQAQADKQRVLEYFKSFSNQNRKEESRENKKLDKQLKVYEQIADLRASADDKESKILDNKKKVVELEEKLKEVKKSGNKDEIKNLQDQIKEIKKENKTLKSEAKKSEHSASTKENVDGFKEGFSDVFETAFSDFNKQLDQGVGKTVGETSAQNLIKTMKGVGQAIKEGLNQINESISTYADYQTSINARMQGARGDTVEIFGALEENLSKVSYSPLIRTEDLYSNLSDLVAEGISANVEQRAFLQTVKDGIATTFDANNSALKRIIRLQQYDSTAARLGMEAYLTSYLNELTQNTEYLQSTFDSVAESLIEASSLMSAKTSTEFEYVIQKWLGTLEGLGLDETTATNISTAIGYLGSGNVSELASSNMQNLLVMATVKSGLSYSDLLTNGLTADTTNQIMYNIVNYLAELGSDSNNNVVKSQLASTFGVNVSDLVAAKNIVQNNAQNSTITNLYNNLLTYNDMYNELERQMGQLSEREGIANILENLFSNFTYSTGMGIASNPALYATWKITDMIQSVTGGINIPFVTAAGFGLDLETTVENLMKIAIVGASTLSGIGDIISGLQSVGDGSSLLSSIGIGSSANTNVIARGTGYNTRASGKGTSISTMIGNANSQDYVSSTITAAEDAQQEKIDAAQSEETSIDKLNDYMQGEGKEISEGTLESIRALNDKIDRGITVRLDESSITKLV